MASYQIQHRSRYLWCGWLSWCLCRWRKICIYSDMLVGKLPSVQVLYLRVRPILCCLHLYAVQVLNEGDTVNDRSWSARNSVPYWRRVMWKPKWVSTYKSRIRTPEPVCVLTDTRTVVVADASWLVNHNSCALLNFWIRRSGHHRRVLPAVSYLKNGGAIFYRVMMKSYQKSNRTHHVHVWWIILLVMN